MTKIIINVMIKKIINQKQGYALFFVFKSKLQKREENVVENIKENIQINVRK